MCYQVGCRTCGKRTWSGCGRHVDSAMAGVKQDDLCFCDSKLMKQDCPGCGKQQAYPTPSGLKQVFDAHIVKSPACKEPYEKVAAAAENDGGCCVQ